MRGRLALVAAVVSVSTIAVALSASAVRFSEAQGTAAVASDATVAFRAEQVLSAAAVSRSLLSGALVTAEYADGTSSSLTREVILETHSAFEELRIRVDALADLLPTSGSNLRGISEDLIAGGMSILSQAEQSPMSIPPTDQIAIFTSNYADLIDKVADERDARTDHVMAIRDGAAVVANAARFVVAFFIPALAIVGYLWIDRRRAHHLEVTAELKREQEQRKARDEFLAAVSHELRTPLTAVVGFAETLRDGRNNLNTGERNEIIEILADQAQDTASIVEDLLVLARATTGDLTVQPEKVDVRDVVDRLAPGWSRNDRTRLSVSGGAMLWADPLRLRQILRCLVANAFQHGGDHIEIRITEGIATARIEIVDDGPGIPISDRGHIFEPYQRTTKDPGQPARIGLGLTVAQTLARLMKGEITYHNLQTDSIFELTLPIDPDTRPAPDGKDSVTLLPAGTPTPLDILNAIQEESFNIMFQPIVDLASDATATVIGYEALSRFPFGTPPQWFSVAEAAGLRLKLEIAAIGKALDAFKNAPEHLFLTLNLSANTLASTRLIDVLDGTAPHRIILELTEDSIIRSYESITETLAILTNKGYRLAIDDMGTGYTDLWHLVRIHPDVVKLDMSLIRNIDTDPDKRALVTGITGLCKGLGSEVIAEGVETPEERDCVLNLGIHWGQGYLFGRAGDL